MKRYKIVEINSIERRNYKGRVCDLHVEDDHSYTVGDRIAVHNSACETRRKAGVGVPQFHALERAAAARRKETLDIQIMSDGGIVYMGDIPKALIWAESVMIGSLFAATSETPGRVFRNDDGEFYKVYGGSASGENKLASGGDGQFVEGVMKTVSFKGHVKHVVREIKESIQMAFAYVGANNLDEFRCKVRWNEIDVGGHMESKYMGRR